MVYIKTILIIVFLLKLQAINCKSVCVYCYHLHLITLRSFICKGIYMVINIGVMPLTFSQYHSNDSSYKPCVKGLRLCLELVLCKIKAGKVIYL